MGNIIQEMTTEQDMGWQSGLIC